MLTVSNAKIKSWRRCRREAHFKYVEKIERKRPEPPLLKGKIIHELIEAYYTPGRSWKKVLESFRDQYEDLFIEEQEEYGDIIEDLEKVMKSYIYRYKDDTLNYIKFNGQKFEIEEEIEFIPGKVNLTIKADGLGEDKMGRRWLVERKSFSKKIPGEGVRYSDMQTTIYYWGFKKKGLKLDGVLWDYIKSKPPKEPDVLKNGGISKRQRIDTDYYTYLKAIKDNGLDPNDYQDMLEMLKEKEDDRFRRIQLPSPDKIAEPLIEDMKKTSLEIYHLLGISKEKNLGWHCDRCQYNPLCQAELRGLDTDYMRKADYKERRFDDAEEKTEQSE